MPLADAALGPRTSVMRLNVLCLRLQRGCGMRGWGRDGLGAGAQGRGREGAESVDVVYAHAIVAIYLVSAARAGPGRGEGREAR